MVLANVLEHLVWSHGDQVHHIPNLQGVDPVVELAHSQHVPAQVLELIRTFQLLNCFRAFKLLQYLCFFMGVGVEQVEFFFLDVCVADDFVLALLQVSD